MELRPISKSYALTFLNQQGSSIASPKEWMTAWVELHGVLHEWDEVRLLRLGNEELSISLKYFKGQKRVVAEWPLSGPGRYQLQMFIRDMLVDEQIVTIQPGKISTEAYERLIEDLETRLPATIALALQRGGALTGLSFLPPSESTLAMELIRLQRAILGTSERTGLAQVLRTLAQSPHQILDTTESWTLLERARRPHPSRLVQALSKPYNLDKEIKPIRVLDTHVEHSVDVYENRLLKVFWQLVHLRLRRLTSIMAKQSGKNALLEEVQKLCAVLQIARQEATFLNDVTLPSHLPTHITMVLLRNPFYRAALEGYLEFHRSPMVRLEEPSLSAPLENLPFLYQMWGTLQVVSALLEVATNLNYKVRDQQLARKDTQGIYLRLLPDGKPLVILEHPTNQTIIKIIPESRYARFQIGSKDMFYSLSFEQRPDIAVEIQTSEGSRIYLFDPKYKLSKGYDEEVGKPKKEDIDKMHTYRDAIRGREQQRVVKYAAILYPGSNQSYGDGVEALQAYPSMELPLHERLKSIFLAALRD